MTDSSPPPALVQAVVDLQRNMQPQPDVTDQVARNCTIPFCFDGDGAPLAVGKHVYLPNIPFPARINGWDIRSDVTGSVSFTVESCTFASFPTFTSIVAAAPPAMTSNRKAAGSIPEVATWTDVISRGDDFHAIIDSISGGITVMTLSLRAKRLDL